MAVHGCDVHGPVRDGLAHLNKKDDHAQLAVDGGAVDQHAAEMVALLHVVFADVGKRDALVVDQVDEKLDMAAADSSEPELDRLVHGDDVCPHVVHRHVYQLVLHVQRQTFAHVQVHSAAANQQQVLDTESHARKRPEIPRPVQSEGVCEDAAPSFVRERPRRAEPVAQEQRERADKLKDSVAQFWQEQVPQVVGLDQTDSLQTRHLRRVAWNNGQGRERGL
ncbi:hypothetical protein BC831DRAFT_463421 [Entophlyctis helioformis]|nr:hypothetical protein BC831DRAFT_463421 [Entophlyctis helioformis]